MSKKKELSTELKAECVAAKRLFVERKNALGLTQAKLAEAADISSAAVAMYLNGTNAINAKFAAALSSLIGVPVERFSPRLAREIGSLAAAIDIGAEDANTAQGPSTRGLIPLISWVRAGSWSEAIEVYTVDEPEQWLPCPASHGARSFALRVRGESMFDPHGRRSFRDGDVIYVDPDRQPENGSLVVAKLTDNQEATFKQLVIEGQYRYLKALNPAWPNRIIPINGNCHIVGVVFSKVELYC